MNARQIIKKKNRISLSLSGLTLIICTAIVGWSYVQREPDSNLVVAFCGSASKPALEECVKAFKERTGISVELHFSGSGKMLSELLVSKKGDLYIPGSPDYMTKAIQQNAVYAETVKRIAYLVPAIIVQKGNPKGITRLADLAKPEIAVGIGDPDSVCVGAYAKEVLEVNGLYDKVKTNIIVHAESCSKTAALIPLGTIDAIIGWRVFHYWSEEKTDIIYIEPKNHVPKLAYISAAISTYSQNRNDAERFIDFLASNEGQRHFREHDYLVTEEEARRYGPTAVVPTVLESSKVFEIGEEAEIRSTPSLRGDL